MARGADSIGFNIVFGFNNRKDHTDHGYEEIESCYNA